jgi:hypothetical protein
MNDETRKQLTPATPPMDTFDGFTDHVEGREPSQDDQTRIIYERISFTNDFKWVDRSDAEMPADLELIVMAILRVTQKWIDSKPVETYVHGPGVPFLDVELLNNQASRSEWHHGPDGKDHGPWQSCYVVQLLDPQSMTRFSWPTATVGGGIAVRELRTKVTDMRMLRGEQVHPIVKLSDAFMNTRFGGRQRPLLAVQRWIMLGGSGKPALPAPAPKPMPMVEVTEPVLGIKPLPGRMQVVAEPTLAERMQDELPPWNDDPGDASINETPAPAPTSISTTPSTPRKPAAPSQTMNRRGGKKIVGGHGR